MWSRSYLPWIIASIVFLPLPGGAQDADSLIHPEGTRAYWKELKALQNARFEEFRDWQKQYLNVTDSRFSMLWSIGYGFPVINQRVEAIYPFLGTSIRRVKPDGTVTETGIYTTDGKGFRANFTGRVMFNTFAGIELGVAAEWYDEILNGSISTPTFESRITSQSYAVTVTPQLVLSSPNLRNFYVYGRIGFHTPVWGGSRSQVRVDDREGSLIREILDSDLKAVFDFGDLFIEYDDILGLLGYQATLNADVKVDFYKNLSVIGFQTAMGFRYQFHKKWGLVAEYFHGGYAPFLKKSEVQEFRVSVDFLGSELVSLTEDGGILYLLDGNQVAIPSDILASTLNVNYHRSLSGDSNNAALNPDGFDATKPADELTDKRLVYSNGFFIGIQYNLPSRGERGKANLP